MVFLWETTLQSKKCIPNSSPNMFILNGFPGVFMTIYLFCTREKFAINLAVIFFMEKEILDFVH